MKCKYSRESKIAPRWERKRRVYIRAVRAFSVHQEVTSQPHLKTEVTVPGPAGPALRGSVFAYLETVYAAPLICCELRTLINSVSGSLNAVYCNNINSRQSPLAGPPFAECRALTKHILGLVLAPIKRNERPTAGREWWPRPCDPSGGISDCAMHSKQGETGKAVQENRHSTQLGEKEVSSGGGG